MQFKSLWLLTLLGASLFFSANTHAQLSSIRGSDVRTNSGLVSECDFCLCSQGISPLEMGRTGVRYDIRYLSLDQLYQDGKRVDNSTRDAETHLTQQFTMLYRIADNFSAIAIVPFANRQENVLEPNDNRVLTNSAFSNTGFGDLSLFARYNLLNDHEFADTRIFSVTGGVKLATGNTAKLNAKGELVDAHMQLGTGSTDVLLGVGGLLGYNDWSVALNLLASLAGKGANGHQFGNNLNYDLGGRYLVYPNTMEYPTVFAALAIRGEWRAQEKQDGELDPNSGGNVMYLAPGVQVFLSNKLSLEASYNLPILHALTGLQLGETYKIMSGLQYMF